MSETSWASLRDLLAARYDVLKTRLAMRLGSTDLARESLQETWLKLSRAGTVGQLRSPEAYLFRVALNVAARQRDVERRRVAFSEVELLMRMDEDELTPERVALARSAHATLLQALEELPSRRRAIFIMARLEKMPHREIAAHFGVSVRTVKYEWKQAFDHLCERLEINIEKPCTSGDFEPS